MRMRTSSHVFAALLVLLALVGAPGAQAELLQTKRTFWLAYFGNVTSAGTPQLSIGAIAPGNAIVEIPGRQNLELTYGVGTTNSVLPVDLAYFGENETVTSKAVRVATSTDVSIVATNLASGNGSAGSYMAIPESALGTEYYVVGPPPPSLVKVGVIATRNGTSIEVKPSAALQGRTSADSFTVNMNAGEVFFFSGQGLSGTKVSSNSPIAVVSGSECMRYGTGACEQVIEMLPQVSFLGREHHVIRDLNSKSSSLNTPVGIVATQDATDIWINGSQIAVLNSGESYFATLNEMGTVSSIVTSAKPIVMAQFTNAGSFTASGWAGDTAMQVVTPVEQYVSSTVVLASSTPSNRMMTIIFRNSDRQSLRINDLPVDGEPWPVFQTEYMALRINLPSTTAPNTYWVIQSDGPVSASVLSVNGAAASAVTSTNGLLNLREVNSGSPAPSQSQSPSPEQSPTAEVSSPEPSSSSTLADQATPVATPSVTPTSEPTPSATPTPTPTAEVAPSPSESASSGNNPEPITSPSTTVAPVAPPSAVPSVAAPPTFGGGGGGGGSNNSSPVVAAAPAPPVEVREVASLVVRESLTEVSPPVVRAPVVSKVAIPAMSVGFAAASKKLTAAQAKAIAQKAKSLRPGTQVTCIGYSGVGSNAVVLRALALDRAKVVCGMYAKAAKVKTKVVFGGTLRGSSASNRKVIVRFS